MAIAKNILPSLSGALEKVLEKQMEDYLDNFTLLHSIPFLINSIVLQLICSTT